LHPPVPLLHLSVALQVIAESPSGHFDSVGEAGGASAGSGAIAYGAA